MDTGEKHEGVADSHKKISEHWQRAEMIHNHSQGGVAGLSWWTSDWKVAGLNPDSPRAGLSYLSKYPWAGTQKLLLMCRWHLVWQPLPSVRVLQWAGDSSRVHPGIRPLSKTGFGPLRGKKQRYPATLTDKWKENGMEQNRTFIKWI